MQRNRTLNKSKLAGFARSTEHERNDRFVLARPSASAVELIFSRQYHLDTYTRHTAQRYFEKHQPLKWEFLRDDGECPCCHKHTVTLIFFNQVRLEGNRDLVEITDKAMLAAIQKDFYLGAGDIANPTSP